MKTNKVLVSFTSTLSEDQISDILERIFWDGEYFEDFEDVDWEIK